MDFSPELFFGWPKKMWPTEDHVKKLDEVDKASRVFCWVMGYENFDEHRTNSLCSSTEEGMSELESETSYHPTTSNSAFWLECNDQYQFSISDELARKEASRQSSDEPQIDLITPESGTITPHSDLVLDFFADFGPVFEHEALIKRVFYSVDIDDADCESESHESWNGLHRDEVFLIDLYDTKLWSSLVWE